MKEVGGDIWVNPMGEGRGRGQFCDNPLEEEAGQKSVFILWVEEEEEDASKEHLEGGCESAALTFPASTTHSGEDA